MHSFLSIRFLQISLFFSFLAVFLRMDHADFKSSKNEIRRQTIGEHGTRLDKREVTCVTLPLILAEGWRGSVLGNLPEDSQPQNSIESLNRGLSLPGLSGRKVGTRRHRLLPPRALSKAIRSSSMNVFTITNGFDGNIRETQRLDPRVQSTD